MRTRRLVAALWLGCAAGVVLPGCALFGWGVEAPEVYLVGLEPLESTAFEQRFRVDLRVQNPNDFDLEIDGIDFELAINGVRLTRGLGSQSVAIPRLGEATVSVVATTTLLDLVRQVAAAGQHPGLEYALTGKVFLAGSPRRVSFERSGDLLPR